MITPGYVQTMAAYNAEMNRRTYAAAARLDDTERRADRGAFWGSIHATLSHVLWADRIWMARFGVGEPPAVPITQSGRLVENFEELAALRAAEDGSISGWTRALEQADLEGDLSYFSAVLQRRMVKTRAICVVHLFNHQTHHRGQVHALLTARGEDTGATDLPFVLEHTAPH